MHTLIFDRRQIRLAYENNCLLIRQPELPPRTIPLNHIRKIVCLHSVELSTALLGQLWQRGIDFVVLNNRYSERSLAIFPNQQLQVARRCQQYAWQQHSWFALRLAKSLCLKRIEANQKLLAKAPSTTTHYLQAAAQSINQCQHIKTLRGIEGAVQRHIFAYWRQQLPAHLGFEKRQRRPATDPVNALLSLTYTLTHHEAVRQCTAAGLDPQLGFYHRMVSGRHSLACDIMEPIRPYCEAWVMQQFMSNTFNRSYFSINKQTGAAMLGKKGRSLFYQLIELEMPSWSEKLQQLAQWVCQEIDEYNEVEHHAHSTMVFDSI